LSKHTGSNLSVLVPAGGKLLLSTTQQKDMSESKRTTKKKTKNFPCFAKNKSPDRILPTDKNPESAVKTSSGNRTTGYNSTLPKVAVQCFIGQFCG